MSNLWLIPAAALVVAANIAVLPNALATDDANDRAYIETVKADNYEQSEQAANARYANERLRAMRGDK